MTDLFIISGFISLFFLALNPQAWQSAKVRPLCLCFYCRED